MKPMTDKRVALAVVNAIVENFNRHYPYSHTKNVLYVITTDVEHENDLLVWLHDEPVEIVSFWQSRRRFNVEVLVLDYTTGELPKELPWELPSGDIIIYNPWKRK